MRIAIAGLRRPWQSTAMSTSGPAASRTASMILTALRIAAGPSIGFIGPNGTSFIAV